MTLEEKLRTLDQSGTPGPWSTSSEYSVRGPEDDGNEDLVACVAYEKHAIDVELIKEARNALPKTLALLTAVRAYIDNKVFDHSGLYDAWLYDALAVFGQDVDDEA